MSYIEDLRGVVNHLEKAREELDNIDMVNSLGNEVFKYELELIDEAIHDLTRRMKKMELMKLDTWKETMG